MSESEPKRKRVNLLGKGLLAAGIAMAGGGIGLQIFADQIVSSQSHPLITVSKEDFSKANITRNSSPVGSKEYQDANDLIGKELIEQLKIREERIVQTKRIGNFSLGGGVFIAYAGANLLWRRRR